MWKRYKCEKKDPFKIKKTKKIKKNLDFKTKKENS